MHDLLRAVVEERNRSGDRIGAGGDRIVPASIGADAVRLARLAASIHMVESAMRLARAGEGNPDEAALDPAGAAGRRPPMR
jgi:hypothetical protein